MNDYTRFESLLFGFLRKNNIGLIQPDENLQYVIYIDDYEVRCFTTAGYIFIQIDLGCLPSAVVNRQGFLKNLLQQSLLDVGDFGSAISLNKYDRLVLSSRVPLDDCGLAELEMSLSGLVNQSDIYRDLLAEENCLEPGGNFGMISVC